MPVRGKLGSSLVALAFAVPFGAVGALATWGITGQVRDNLRARDWVLVQAKVDDAALQASRGSKGGTTYQANGAYRYAVGGREYVGTRLGLDTWDASDNIGDWQASMAAFLEEARSTGRTIPVYVNPDNPAEAMVDRDLRWGMLLVMGVFALLFGGVGVGGLIAFGAVWFGGKKPGRRRAAGAKPGRKAVAAAGLDRAPAANPAPIASDGRASVRFLWGFTAIWNLISLPVAILAWQEIVDGEWLVALVLIFPLFGAVMLYSCIVQSLTLLFRGRATLSLGDTAPRMGGRFSGVIRFERAARAGREFDVRLVASHRDPDSQGSAPVHAWWRDLSVRSAADPRGGLRLPFQFDLPSRLNVAGVPPGEEAHRLRWRVTVKPRGSSQTPESFDIRVERSREPVENLPPPDTTAEERRNAAAIEKLLGAQAAAKLTAAQRASFAELSPDAQAMVGKLVTNAGAIRKVGIGIGILFAAGFVAASLVF